MASGNFPTLLDYTDALEKLVAAYREVCHHSQLATVQTVNAYAYHLFGEELKGGYQQVYEDMQAGRIPIDKEWYEWLIQ